MCWAASVSPAPRATMKPRFAFGRTASGSLGILGIFLGGCMTYPVQVEARRELRATIPAGRTYYLDAAVTDPLQRDPHFGPAMICLRTAMMHRAFVEVMHPEQAAITVEFAY